MTPKQIIFVGIFILGAIGTVLVMQGKTFGPVEETREWDDPPESESEVESESDSDQLVLLDLDANEAPIASNQPTSAQPSGDQPVREVPQPTGEDVIRTFFNLIAEKSIPEAIGMMTPAMIGDESSKQSWGVQFNEMESVQINKITPWQQTDWKSSTQQYQVILSVEMSADAANAPIPYYGWDGDPDVRWVTLEQGDNGLWRIANIATGP